MTSTQNRFLLKLMFDEKMRDQYGLYEIHQSIKGSSNYDVNSAKYSFESIVLHSKASSCLDLPSKDVEFTSYEREKDMPYLERMYNFIENDKHYTTIEIDELGAYGNGEDDLIKFSNKNKEYIFELLEIMDIPYYKNTNNIKISIEDQIDARKNSGGYWR